MAKLRTAVFLDRDGTLNEERGYVYRVEDWAWIPGAVEAIKGFNQLGFLVIVVTNQAGIARGYYGHEDVKRLHLHVQVSAASRGAIIDGLYYCPHHSKYGEDSDCNCRKPRPGLLYQAQEDYNIDLQTSFIIGDKASDIDAGTSVGATGILVETGYGKYERYKLNDQSIVVADLYEAYKLIGRISCGTQKDGEF